MDIDLVKVRVRGIYSTALTKLLLESNFRIVQPSVMQEERFDVQGGQEPYNLDIKDRPNCQGIHVLGKADDVDTFYSLIRSQLFDVVTRRWNIAIDGIYKGLIKRFDREESLAFVDIGPAIGWLKIRENKNLEFEEIVVQVQRRRLGFTNPILSVEITNPGEYAILIPKRQIKISNRIRDQCSRDRLHELSVDLNLDCGVIWRTAASDQPADVLMREVAELSEKRHAIREKGEAVEAPALLWGETYFMDVEFPAQSKKRFDELRSMVVPTINDHHFYKVCGGRVGSAVDMAERLLERGRQQVEVQESFKRVIEVVFPIEGSLIEIEHVKLDGRVFNLGRAEIVTFNQNDASIKYRRDFKKGGIYDGLGAPKEEGDYAVTETKIGEWYLKTRYYSKNRQFKGMYVNLNTPIELYPHKLRYLDLEVDISIQPDGEVSVLDKEKMEEKVGDGYITRDLAEKVRRMLKDLLDEIKR